MTALGWLTFIALYYGTVYLIATLDAKLCEETGR